MQKYRLKSDFTVNVTKHSRCVAATATTHVLNIVFCTDVAFGSHTVVYLHRSHAEFSLLSLLYLQTDHDGKMTQK